MNSALAQALLGLQDAQAAGPVPLASMVDQQPQVPPLPVQEVQPPQQPDPYDFTDRYNTQLSPEQEAQFQAWAKANGRDRDSYDYDMRGAFASGVAQSENGHYPDTFKKPNHPTFSTGSIYARGGPYQAGEWSGGQDGALPVFTPGATNMDMMGGTAGLRRYFASPAEDGNSRLNLPPLSQVSTR